MQPGCQSTVTKKSQNVLNTSTSFEQDLRHSITSEPFVSNQVIPCRVLNTFLDVGDVHFISKPQRHKKEAYLIHLLLGFAAEVVYDIRSLLPQRCSWASLLLQVRRSCFHSTPDPLHSAPVACGQAGNHDCFQKWWPVIELGRLPTFRTSPPLLFANLEIPQGYALLTFNLLFASFSLFYIIV